MNAAAYYVHYTIPLLITLAYIYIYVNKYVFLAAAWEQCIID